MHAQISRFPIWTPVSHRIEFVPNWLSPAGWLCTHGAVRLAQLAAGDATHSGAHQTHELKVSNCAATDASLTHHWRRCISALSRAGLAANCLTSTTPALPLRTLQHWPGPGQFPFGCAAPNQRHHRAENHMPQKPGLASAAPGGSAPQSARCHWSKARKMRPPSPPAPNRRPSRRLTGPLRSTHMQAANCQTHGATKVAGTATDVVSRVFRPWLALHRCTTSLGSCTAQVSTSWR